MEGLQEPGRTSGLPGILGLQLSPKDTKQGNDHPIFSHLCSW